MAKTQKTYIVPIRYLATEQVVVKAKNQAEAIKKAIAAPMNMENMDFDQPEVDEDSIEEE